MKNEERMAAALKPVKEEIKNLITMFDFYLVQRRKAKPIETLSESVRDMRLILGRILIDHFLGLDNEDEEKFVKALAELLADSCESASERDEDDEAYFGYCMEEILTPFEYAMEIKSEFSDDPVLQKMLSLDIPILRPFDYGLSGNLKVIEAGKRRRSHR